MVLCITPPLWSPRRRRERPVTSGISALWIWVASTGPKTRVGVGAVLLLTGLVMLVTGCVGGPDEPGNPFDPQDILSRRAQLVAATLDRDWRGVGLLHAADAILIPPSGRVIEGRDSIQAFLTTPSDVETEDVTYVNLRISGTDSLAYVVAAYEYEVVRGADTTRVRGPYAAVWRQHPLEGWQIQVMSWH